MTHSRLSQAFWELCRQGFPLAAEKAVACWERGEPFVLDEETQVARYVEELIEECNWTITRAPESA